MSGIGQAQCIPKWNGLNVSIDDKSIALTLNIYYDKGNKTEGSVLKW